MRSKIFAITLVLTSFLSQAEASTTPTTVFLLENANKTSPLGISFNSMATDQGITRSNQANGEFRTLLTPTSPGNKSQADFSFWPRASSENHCHFKSLFLVNGLATVTAQSQGKATCWVSQLANNFYILHAAF